MPIYEYLCNSCGYEFEEVQQFSDPPLEERPDCGKNSAERQVSMSSFHLTGGGWYKDGYSSHKSDSEKPENATRTSKTKEKSTSENSSSTEKLSKTEKKESTSNTKPKNTSKEKAA